MPAYFIFGFSYSMNVSHANEQPIDAVITWVDGKDPKHQAKLAEYLQSIGGERPITAHPTRFHDAGEIEYCVVSLLRFAPWIRTIFIVTDNQTPEFVHKLKGTVYEHRVKMIDHRVIFAGYENCLPTFNIRSIMTVLWRIPDLANRFLFLNDDFAIIRPIKPEDFFRDGKVIVRGKWKLLSDYRPSKIVRAAWRKLFPLPPSKLKQARAKHLLAQEKSAKLAGFKWRYLQLQHNPHPWRRSTMESFFQARPELMRENVKEKLRSSTQFISECLAAYLELKQGDAIVDNSLKTLQMKPSGKDTRGLSAKLALAESQECYAFMCVQSIERGSQAEQELMFNWLNQHVGRLDDVLAAPLHSTGLKDQY